MHFTGQQSSMLFMLAGVPFVHYGLIRISFKFV